MEPKSQTVTEVSQHIYALLRLLIVVLLIVTMNPFSAIAAPSTPQASPLIDDENCIPVLLEFPRDETEYPCAEGPKGDAVVKWRAPRPTLSSSGSIRLTLHGDALIAETDVETYALDAETGRTLWINDEQSGPPYSSWIDGQVMVQILDYSLSSLSDDGEWDNNAEMSYRVIDTSTGETLLADSVSGCKFACEYPLLVNTTLLIDRPIPDSRYRTLEVYNAETGALLWDQRAVSNIQASAASYSIDDSHIYLVEGGVSGKPQSLKALDRLTGKTVWNTELAVRGSEGMNLVHHKQNLYLVDPNASPSLLAFDAGTGEISWTSFPKGAVYPGDGIVGVQDSLIVVKSSSVQEGGPTFLQAIELKSGEVIWLNEIWGGFVNIPAEWIENEFKDNFFVFVSDFELGTEEIRAFDSATGQERWRSDLGHPSPSIFGYLLFDGRVYISGYYSNPSPGDSGFWASSLNASNGLDWQLLIEPGPKDCALVASNTGVFCAISFESLITPTMEWALPSTQYEQDEGTGEVLAKEPEEGIVLRRSLRSESLEGDDFFRYGEVFTSLVLEDGFVYVAAEDGTVFALGGNEGPHAIEQTEPSAIGTPSIGDRAVISGSDVVLRAAPAESGVELMPLDDGTVVHITAGPIDEGRGIWWQVREPRSGNVGYLPSEVLVLPP